MKRFFTVLILFLPHVLYPADMVQGFITVGADGVQETYTLADAHKVLLTSNKMSILQTNGQTLTSEISAILFTHALESALPNLETASVYVFPNPVSDYLVVRGLEGENVISLYSMDGVLHKTIQVFGDHIQIAVDDLSKGVYLLQVNHYVLKFIKK